jgi:hypothetical protein
VGEAGQVAGLEGTEPGRGFYLRQGAPQKPCPQPLRTLRPAASHEFGHVEAEAWRTSPVGSTQHMEGQHSGARWVAGGSGYVPGPMVCSYSWSSSLFSQGPICASPGTR